MKILLLISLITSLNAYSAQTCDLSVNIPQVDGGKSEIVTAEATASVSSEKDDETYMYISLSTAAIKSCESKGGIECVVKTKNVLRDRSGGTFTNYRYTHNYRVYVEGKRIIGGKKITDAQYAKKRARILCQKIDTCINDALNDSQSTLLYLEKLEKVKNMNKCNEVENIIFEN